MYQRNVIDVVQLIEAHTTFAPRCFNQPAPPSLEARRAQAADFYQSRFAAGLGLREAVAS